MEEFLNKNACFYTFANKNEIKIVSGNRSLHFRKPLTVEINSQRLKLHTKIIIRK